MSAVDPATGEIKRIAYEIHMRETHRKDRPWCLTNWGKDATDRAAAIRSLEHAREINKTSPYKPEFKLLELLTTVIEVKP